VNHAYVFAGIDKRVVIDQAIRKSKTGDDFLVHMHSAHASCSEYMHVGYSKGEKVEEYGNADGSASTGALASGRVPPGPALGD
jgi:hypothetical protein